MMRFLYALWLIVREAAATARFAATEDLLTEPLEIGRCPMCKSTKITPMQSDPPVWNCQACYYEFDPLERVRERDRLRDSWKEAGGK